MVVVVARVRVAGAGWGVGVLDCAEEVDGFGGPLAFLGLSEYALVRFIQMPFFLFVESVKRYRLTPPRNVLIKLLHLHLER